MTVAGADPESAAKKAQARTSVIAIPPRTPPTMDRAKSQILREMPPFVIRLPARTKNAIAMMEVESRPPKILCATVLTLTVISGSRTIAAVVDTPRERAMGTPMIRRSAKPANIIIPAISYSSFSSGLLKSRHCLIRYPL